MIKKLANGILVVHNQRPEAKTIRLDIYSGLGSFKESKEGLTHFLEHMMFRGTQQYSRDEILRILQYKNTQFNGFTNYENVALQGRCLFENFQNISNVFLSMISESLFIDQDIEEETQIIGNEYLDLANDASFHLTNSVQTFRWNLGEILVDPNNIHITKEDLRNRNQEVWNPTRMVIYITSCLQDTQILDILGNWETISVAGQEKNLFEISYEHNGTVPFKEVSFPTGNTILVVGEISSKLVLREGIITRIISSVFSNGMGGRLMRSLRNEKSLVYGAGLGFSLSKIHNTINFCADCNPKHYLEIYQIFLNLIGKPISRKEFDIVKEDLMASSIFSSEDLGSSHSRMINGYMNYGEVYTEEEVICQLESISLEDILEYQQKMFNSKTFSVHTVQNG